MHTCTNPQRRFHAAGANCNASAASVAFSLTGGAPFVLALSRKTCDRARARGRPICFGGHAVLQSQVHGVFALHRRVHAPPTAGRARPKCNTFRKVCEGQFRFDVSAGEAASCRPTANSKKAPTVACAV
ncbi:hypothetical protein MRX96_046326 [Rhipicephalus microplus]